MAGDDDAVSVMMHGHLALIAGHRDDRDTVEEHLVAAPDQVFDSPQRRMAAWSLLLARTLAAEQAGRPGEAVAVLAPCLDPGVAEDMPDRYLLLPTPAPPAPARRAPRPAA